MIPKSRLKEILTLLNAQTMYFTPIRICEGCDEQLIPIERAFCLSCDPHARTFGRKSNEPIHQHPLRIITIGTLTYNASTSEKDLIEMSEKDIFAA